MSSRDNKQSEPPGTDRRSSPRISLVRFIWYKVIDQEQLPDGGTREGISRMCDISKTGVGLYVTQPIDAGKRVFLEVATTKENLSAVGQVANARPTADGLFRVGIHFIAIPPNDRLALDNLLSRDEQT